MVVHSVLLYTLCGANVGRHKNSKLCVCVWRERGEEVREGGREERKGGREKGREEGMEMCLCMFVTCSKHLASAGD